jgi:hypothetical protein
MAMATAGYSAASERDTMGISTSICRSGGVSSVHARHKEPIKKPIRTLQGHVIGDAGASKRNDAVSHASARHVALRLASFACQLTQRRSRDSVQQFASHLLGRRVACF